MVMKEVMTVANAIKNIWVSDYTEIWSISNMHRYRFRIKGNILCKNYDIVQEINIKN